MPPTDAAIKSTDNVHTNTYLGDQNVLEKATHDNLCMQGGHLIDQRHIDGGTRPRALTVQLQEPRCCAAGGGLGPGPQLLHVHTPVRWCDITVSFRP